MSQLNESAEAPPKLAAFAAGTAGTATGVMRYFKRNNIPTKMAIVDPQESAIYDWLRTGQEFYLTPQKPWGIYGIGRNEILIYGQNIR